MRSGMMTALGVGAGAIGVGLIASRLLRSKPDRRNVLLQELAKINWGLYANDDGSIAMKPSGSPAGSPAQAKAILARVMPEWQVEMSLLNARYAQINGIEMGWKGAAIGGSIGFIPGAVVGHAAERLIYGKKTGQAAEDDKKWKGAAIGSLPGGPLGAAVGYGVQALMRRRKKKLLAKKAAGGGGGGGRVYDRDNKGRFD